MLLQFDFHLTQSYQKGVSGFALEMRCDIITHIVTTHRVELLPKTGVDFDTFFDAFFSTLKCQKPQFPMCFFQHFNIKNPSEKSVHINTPFG
jgi:hypothetical protein